MKNVIFVILLLSSLILICCDNSNPVNAPGNFAYQIWYTDSLGNSIGGDSNNFCLDQGQVDCFRLLSPYPNPVNNHFTVQYLSGGSMSCPDTLSLFFLKGSDTTWIFKDRIYTNNVHEYLSLNKDSYGFSNEIVTMEMKRKHSNPNSCVCPITILAGNKCRTSGNIRFN